MAGQDWQPMRAVGLATGLGFTLALTVLLGALAGHWLDRRWGTAPWLTLVGTLVGTAVGFTEVMRVTRLMSERDGGASRK